MKPTSKRPTQRLIAQQLGLSVGAVSRALSNDTKMSEQTRALVRKTANELGYAPDRAAQRLRTGRTSIINLILPRHDEVLGFGNLLVQGISEGLEGTPYDLLVWPDHGHEQSISRIKRVVRDNLADGIIFSRTLHDDSRIRFLSEAGFPFVTHGRSELATPHAFVDFDNFGFGQRAAEMLISRGARKLGILLPDASLMFHHHLLHGFMTAVRVAGVEYEVFDDLTLDSDATEISTKVAKRLSEPNAPDGLVFPGDMSGLAGLAAIQDMGRKTGQDIHVVVKQTSGVFDMVRPRVDSLHEDLTAAGRSLAGLMIDRIDGTPPSELQILQPIKEHAAD